MADPVSNIQGLASGIQWRDMIEQIMQRETSRQLTPVQTRATAEQTSVTAWNNYSGVVGKLSDAAQTLRDGTPFDAVNVAVPSSPATSRTLLSASASGSAAVGTYAVRVLDTAAAQKLSGNVVANPSAELGLSGQFVVGGRTITLATTDSLNVVRDKINAANSGTTPSRVSASVLYTGSDRARLVLTSDTGGAAGIDLRDARPDAGSPSLLQQLGLVSGTTANVGTDGATRSSAFVSATAKVAAMTLGVTAVPDPATIPVNGRAVTIDLQTQSLADIAAAINAASPNSASVEAVTNGGTTSQRLKIAGAITGNADAQPTLELLGVVKAATAIVSQQVTTANALEAADGSAADTSTLLLGLKNAGGTGAQMGDTFTVAGTKADGVTQVRLTITVDGAKTVADMLADVSTAFSAAGRHVGADLSGGAIRLTDEAGGASGLAFSIAANNESGVTDPDAGATLSFGATTTDVIGRARELAAGRDARIVVNGVALSRSSNTITDAISGLTLNLLQSEPDTTLNVSVARNPAGVVSAMQNLASAYNAVKSFVDTNTASGGPL